ncbi:hypothetical protein V3C97_04050 [Ligilactobacillus saerimneri]|uniref:hypothetical protein n=1 Tax=Ligilactobacillus saerimneri TaxID=228229 RepID=UPI0030CC839C
MVLRVNKNELGITPFNLLAMLNSKAVRKQLNNLILMDTTLPNIGDRWKDINLDISDPLKLQYLDEQVKNMYQKRKMFWSEYANIFGING